VDDEGLWPYSTTNTFNIKLPTVGFSPKKATYLHEAVYFSMIRRSACCASFVSMSASLITTTVERWFVRHDIPKANRLPIIGAHQSGDGGRWVGGQGSAVRAIVYDNRYTGAQRTYAQKGVSDGTSEGERDMRICSNDIAARRREIVRARWWMLMACYRPLNGLDCPRSMFRVCAASLRTSRITV
jgi:hypothetical protein